jgi:hypothetical protein
MMIRTVFFTAIALAAVETLAQTPDFPTATEIRRPRPSAVFDIKTKKPADQIKVTIERDTAIFDLTSPSGIGAATLTLAQGKWPTTVILRLRLHALESFAVSNGKINLAGSVLSHSGNTASLYLTEDEKERKLEPGTAIRVLDAAGNPITGLPGKGGYFEITLPKALFAAQPTSLMLGWIDAFRG